LVGSYFTDP